MNRPRLFEASLLAAALGLAWYLLLVVGLFELERVRWQGLVASGCAGICAGFFCASTCPSPHRFHRAVVTMLTLPVGVAVHFTVQALLVAASTGETGSELGRSLALAPVIAAYSLLPFGIVLHPLTFLTRFVYLKAAGIAPLAER